MRSKYYLWLITVFTVVFQGCVEWDAGYTNNDDVVKYMVSNDIKVPITYSLSNIKNRNDEPGMSDVKGLRDRIETALIATGLFSEVSYGEKGGADSYHAEFHIRQDGMTIDQSVGLGLALGYTFVLIPMGEVFTLDSYAVLYLQGKPIYSTAKTEEYRRLWWLPVLPAGIVLNPWVVWSQIENGNVNALVNDISDYHKKRFLENIDVKRMKKE